MNFFSAIQSIFLAILSPDGGTIPKEKNPALL
jgi:hypothetical protein